MQLTFNYIARLFNNRSVLVYIVPVVSMMIFILLGILFLLAYAGQQCPFDSNGGQYEQQDDQEAFVDDTDGEENSDNGEDEGEKDNVDESHQAEFEDDGNEEVLEEVEEEEEEENLDNVLPLPPSRPPSPHLQWLSPTSDVSSVCSICLVNTKNIRLDPCGHCLCQECLLQIQIRAQRADLCPFCRQRFDRGQAIFL
jgi:hypothetical protein